jgi:hypothetical protein
MSKNSARVVGWWILVLIGALVVLLIAWATKVVKIGPVTLLTVGAVVIALSWLIVLVSVPWNLYFAVRRAGQEMAVSRERGISVPAASDVEARRISRWLLWLALGGHLGTAIAAAAIAYFSGSKTGYYIAGIFLLSTAFRPAAAYLSHVRERITVLTREATHPREDVVTLRGEVAEIKQSLGELQAGLRQAAEDLRRAEATLTDTITHARTQLAGDLDRLKDAQEADRTRARSRGDDLQAQVGQVARRIDATLDGISDHGELVAGLRTLARIMRTQPS